MLETTRTEPEEPVKIFMMAKVLYRCDIFGGYGRFKIIELMFTVTVGVIRVRERIIRFRVVG